MCACVRVHACACLGHLIRSSMTGRRKQRRTKAKSRRSSTHVEEIQLFGGCWRWCTVNRQVTEAIPLMCLCVDVRGCECICERAAASMNAGQPGADDKRTRRRKKEEEGEEYQCALFGQLQLSLSHIPAAVHSVGAYVWKTFSLVAFRKRSRGREREVERERSRERGRERERETEIERQR